MRQLDAYDAFVGARLRHLLRFGRALTCDSASASRLVGTCLAPVLARWGDDTVERAEDEVRRAMLRHYLRHPSPAPRCDDPAWRSVAALAPRQRAVLALRLHENLTDEETADFLGCSPATARALSGQALSGLDADAVRVALEEPVPVDEADLLEDVRRDADRRRRRRLAVVGLSGLALMGVFAAGAVLASGRDGGPVGLDADVLAMSASASDRVWALTRDDKCRSCTELWRGDGTPDGWTSAYTFEQPYFLAQLRMAPNGQDGWAWFGRDWLMATHDGGDTWVIPGVDLRDSDLQIEVAGPTAWALLVGPSGPRLLRSAADSDAWEPVERPLDPAERLDLVPHGDAMRLQHMRSRPPAWLTEADDGAAMAARSDLPCSGPPPRAAGRTLWTTCSGPGGARVYRSADGREWSEVVVSPRTALGAYPVSGEVVFLVTFGGARLVGTEGPGPATLEDVTLPLAPDESVRDVHFPSEDVGFLLTTRGRVLRSADGGRQWAEIS